MHLRRAFLLAFSSLAMLLGLAPSAANALTLSAPTYDFTVDPGNTVKDVLRVYNEGTLTLTVVPELYNFSAKNEDQGTPDFYSENRNGHELAPWIFVNAAERVIKPGENYNLEYEIRVPQDAAPGGHFGAIHVKIVKVDGQAVDPGSQVNVIGSTPSLIFVRVTGAAEDKLDVAQFSGDKKLYSHLPVDLKLRVMNQGNTHLRPVGNVFVHNMFGRQVASIEVNPTFKTVLPATGRRFEISWFKHRVDESASELTKQVRNFAFGKYTAILALNYGADNKVVGGTYEFWVVPGRALLLLLAVLIVACLVLGFGLKSYNKLVIRRYEAMKNKTK